MQCKENRLETGLVLISTLKQKVSQVDLKLNSFACQ